MDVAARLAATESRGQILSVFCPGAQKGQAPLRPEVDRNLPAPDSYQGDNDGEATAIAPVIHTIDRDGTERWFDLSGRQLSGKPAKKGVYIHRGKKQVVK